MRASVFCTFVCVHACVHVCMVYHLIFVLLILRHFVIRCCFLPTP